MSLWFTYLAISIKMKVINSRFITHIAYSYHTLNNMKYFIRSFARWRTFAMVCIFFQNFKKLLKISTRTSIYLFMFPFSRPSRHSVSRLSSLRSWSKIVQFQTGSECVPETPSGMSYKISNVKFEKSR